MIEKGYRQFRIDPEFKALIRPLTKEEYSTLEANLILDGCREPIVTWNGLIVDGHNRYEICNRLHIPYHVVAYDFDSREDAIIWIVSSQVKYTFFRQKVHTFKEGISPQECQFSQ